MNCPAFARSGIQIPSYSESGFSKFKHPIYGDELETFKMYQNREPRFYVNVFWSGMTWSSGWPARKIRSTGSSGSSCP